MTEEYQNDFLNYYAVLESDKNTSMEDIKKNYQRLVISSHPDKSESNTKEKFQLIQKAWRVLRDPKSRRQYDAILTCYENNQILLYDAISLSDMDFDPDEQVYSYECRCGGSYILEANRQMFIVWRKMSPYILITCDECSFSVQINMCSESE